MRSLCLCLLAGGMVFAADVARESDWPLFRGNPEQIGVAGTSLPDTLKVTVRVEPEQMTRHAMSFIIEGQLWAQPVPLSLYLKTELDLETGSVTVAESSR